MNYAKIVTVSLTTCYTLRFYDFVFEIAFFLFGNGHYFW